MSQTPFSAADPADLDAQVPASFGAELGRQRGLTGAGYTLIGVSLAMIVFGLSLFLDASRNSMGKPNIAEIIVSGICIIGAIGLIVLAYRLRDTVVIFQGGIERRAGKRVARIAYDDVKFVLASRKQNYYKGRYLNTSVSLRVSARDDGREAMKTTYTVKDKSTKTGFLSSRLEPTLCAADQAAEILATYIAPRLMDRIDAGEKVKLGQLITLDSVGIAFKHTFSSTTLPWSACSGMAWDEKARLCIRGIDGKLHQLPAMQVAINGNALPLLVQALAEANRAQATA